MEKFRDMEYGEYVLNEYVSRFVDKIVRPKTPCGFDKDLAKIHTKIGLYYKDITIQFGNFTDGKGSK